MAIFNIFKKNTEKTPPTQQATLFNSSPSFSQFGSDIYASDVVQNCIDVIATEISKMAPQHIRVNSKGEQSIPASSLNRLFKFSPNGLMTTRDFLEKIIWLLFLNYNAFIYPMYEIYDDNGIKRKNYTGFYPLNPTQVVFEQDTAGKIYTHFYFLQGEDFTVAYDQIIHLRKKYSVNDIMGGGLNGQPDNDALLSILETNNTVVEGVGKAIKSSLSIRGILKINTVLNDEDQEAERVKFEAAMKRGETGILPIDMKGEYLPIDSDPKLVDTDTMEFIDSKVLRWYGVSQPIISGDFDDEQYQAFYEKTLEPLVISLGQAFSKAVFSNRELNVGNMIVFYQKNMMYLSTTAKLDIIKAAGEQGLLTNDQKLLLLGYPPLGGEAGNKRTQSLNYVDTDLINDYQMTKAQAPQINATGGKE